MRGTAPFFVAVIGLSGACTPSALPSAAAPHRRLSEIAAPDAPPEVETARRRAAELVREADRAASEGKKESADALYALAEVHLDIADAHGREAALDEKIRVEEAANRDLAAEVEQLREAIAQEEHALALRELRRRLETVVSEAERTAAAEEEYRARFKGEKTVLARRKVGGHWIARAALLAETVEAYATLGLVETADAKALHPLMTHAEDAFEAGDLFAVENRCATLAADAQDRLSSAWTDGAVGSTRALDTLAETLKKSNIPFYRDDLGLWINLGDTPKRPAARTKALVKKLVDALGIAPATVVAVSAALNAKSAEKAVQESFDSAVKLAELLASAGADSRAIRARGTGEFSPTPALATGDTPTALLLFPIPVIQTK